MMLFLVLLLLLARILHVELLVEPSEVSSMPAGRAAPAIAHSSALLNSC